MTLPHLFDKQSRVARLPIMLNVWCKVTSNVLIHEWHAWLWKIAWSCNEGNIWEGGI